MRRILWFVFIASATAQFLSGCEISIRDQVSLIEMSREAPSPGTVTLNSVEAATVLCAALPPLVLVRPSANASFVYVFDPRRVFNRWSVTGAAMDGDFLRALGGYLNQYRKMNRWQFWSQFGVLPLQVPAGVTTAPALKWQEYRLLTRKGYESAKAESVEEEDEEFFRRLIRDRIHAYLGANTYTGADITDFRYPQISPNAANVTVGVRISRAAKEEDLEFVVPVNTKLCPFVGYPVLR